MTHLTQLTLSGLLQPEHTKTYVVLPFVMPTDVASLNVTYSYSDAIGSDPHLQCGNTIDIGIFDPNTARGWSGSARDRFFLSMTDATPGYMPGPLSPGVWHICLGAYKVADAGCEYNVTLDFTYGERDTEASFPERLPLRDTPSNQRPDGWYRGELHCHSSHSDGDSDPIEVVRKAEAVGLDFLALTDHNVLSQQAALSQIETPLMLIPGMEVTTYRGHWNVWGDGDWIDFRVTSQDQMQHALDQALASGYLTSCNHPRPYGPEWEYPDVEGFRCTEVWNGPWQLMNRDALAYWEDRLKRGIKSVAVGGSDSHFHHRDHHAQLGHPTTYIYSSGTASPQTLLDGIRAGHVFVTESPAGPQLYLSSGEAMMGDTLYLDRTDPVTLSVRAVDAAGMRLELHANAGLVHEQPVTTDEWQAEIQIDVQSLTYVRAQLVPQENHTDHVHALTNPIHLQSKD
jgi:hypothetical protein